MTDTPKVRAVVVNYNGESMLARCIEHLLATEWPASHLDIVVVDNASTDGSAERSVDLDPSRVRVIRSDENRGFAGGANLGLQDLDGVDFVALINNDAFVTPGWLVPLVEALQDDPSIGAANAKVVFEHQYVEVELETEAFAVEGDPRVLGVRVSGARVGDRDALPGAIFSEGFFGEEHGPADEPRFCWSGPRAELWIPVPRDDALPCNARLRLATVSGVRTKLISNDSSTAVDVGPTPEWYDLELLPPAFDVINNVGNVLVDQAYGADRGFLERDDGQYASEAEVFGWCGAAVLLRKEYLADVGVFDERYFLYYEDADLAWRGRLLGWRYVYVPGSVVRHLHAATTVEGSKVFGHYLERNRLLTLAKNAPAGVAVIEVLRYLAETWSLRFRRGVSREVARRRARSFIGFLKLLPRALAARWSLGRRRAVRRRSLLAWSVPRESGRWAVTRGRAISR